MNPILTVYGPNRYLTTGTLAINYITEKAIFEIKKVEKEQIQFQNYRLTK